VPGGITGLPRSCTLHRASFSEEQIVPAIFLLAMLSVDYENSRPVATSKSCPVTAGASPALATKRVLFRAWLYLRGCLSTHQNQHPCKISWTDLCNRKVQYDSSIQNCLVPLLLKCLLAYNNAISWLLYCSNMFGRD
jgi:hypothetical protein